MEISLKKYSIQEIEKRISATLSELCGESVDVEISGFSGKVEGLRWNVAINAVFSHQLAFEQMEQSAAGLNRRKTGVGSG